MNMTLPKLFIISTIFISVVPFFISCQNCIPEPEKLDVYYKALNSPITVLAKVKSTNSKKTVFQISMVYKINNGGLKKKQKITIGPVQAGPECPVLKKKAEYLLFLEEKKEDGTYEFHYNPETISKRTKKTMKKVVCSGCAKAPKFTKPKQKKKVSELQLKSTHKIDCKAKGNPKPVMQVFKDGKILKSAKGVKVAINKKGGRATITFKSISKENFGVYVCNANNAGGSQNISEELMLDSCIPCNTTYKKYCKNGRCCWNSDLLAPVCRCEASFEGSRCEKRKFNIYARDGLSKAGTDKKVIAIMALIMALIVCGIVCYVVYCKSKKPKSIIRNRKRRSNARAVNRGAEMTALHTNRTSTSAGGNNNSNSFAQHPSAYEHVTVPNVPETQNQTERLVRTEDERSSNDSPQGRKRKNGHSFNTGDRKPNAINISHSNIAPQGSHHPETQIESQDTALNAASSLIAKQNVPSNFSSTASMVEGENKYSHDHRAHPELPYTSTVDHIISQNIHQPPSYITVGKDGDYIDGVTPASPTSPHKVTTFENDGQVKEMTVERVTGVTPHSPKMSPMNLQRQNRVYSSEQSESALTPTTDTFPVYENQPPISNMDEEEEETNRLMPYPDPDSENDELDHEEEMKQPLYQSVKSSQAHQIPLTSQRSSNNALPTVPLSSSSSIEDDTESRNRSINV